MNAYDPKDAIDYQEIALQDTSIAKYFPPESGIEERIEVNQDDEEGAGCTHTGNDEGSNELPFENPRSRNQNKLFCLYVSVIVKESLVEVIVPVELHN